METYKKVANNGQISIGKEWAGKLVRITSNGTKIEIVPGDFIPEDQQVFHTAQAKKSLKEFNSWAEENEPKQTDLNALKKKLRGKK